MQVVREVVRGFIARICTRAHLRAIDAPSSESHHHDAQVLLHDAVSCAKATAAFAVGCAQVRVKLLQRQRTREEVLGHVVVLYARLHGAKSGRMCSSPRSHTRRGTDRAITLYFVHGQSIGSDIIVDEARNIIIISLEPWSCGTDGVHLSTASASDARPARTLVSFTVCCSAQQRHESQRHSFIAQD